MIGYKMIVIQL